MVAAKIANTERDGRPAKAMPETGRIVTVSQGPAAQMPAHWPNKGANLHPSAERAGQRQEANLPVATTYAAILVM